jgi:hypothetical protein
MCRLGLLPCGDYSSRGPLASARPKRARSRFGSLSLREPSGSGETCSAPGTVDTFGSPSIQISSSVRLR